MTDEPEDPNNPFKGTPFEQMFQAFGGAFGGGSGTGGAGVPDLNALLGQMQAMMTPHEGSVNWQLAKDVARRTVAAEPDPTPSTKQRTDVADALRLADHWLDSATDLPSGIGTSDAWSRADWVEETLEVWQRLVEPVAEHVVSAMGNALPEEAKAMAGPLMGILNQAGGAMFGTQVGQALGGLASEVLTASDIGAADGGTAAMVSTHSASVIRALFAHALSAGMPEVNESKWRSVIDDFASVQPSTSPVVESSESKPRSITAKITRPEIIFDADATAMF